MVQLFARVVSVAVALLLAGGSGLGAGPAPEPARTIRLLRSGAVLVAVVLRGGRRARDAAAAAVRHGAAAIPSSSTGCGRNTSSGFPEFCQVPAPRLDRNIVSSMIDLMPAPRLIFHNWDKHGTCSGLPQRAYFETVRKARAVVKIPEPYLDPKAPLTVTPDEVEDAFVKANPGLPRDAISVTCDHRRLGEVRICMSRDLQFRSCPDVDTRACRRDKVVMPPVRGGGAAALR